ncbi:MAG: hypothetical protein KC462_08165, partial [Cyanobacteria bacterium HKST-UBA05]|nr:hypothetical protein [Cyanobacteria bacterium HKST-UBA05]
HGLWAIAFYVSTKAAGFFKLFINLYILFEPRMAPVIVPNIPVNPTASKPVWKRRAVPLSRAQGSYLPSVAIDY